MSPITSEALVRVEERASHFGLRIHTPCGKRDWCQVTIVSLMKTTLFPATFPPHSPVSFFLCPRCRSAIYHKILSPQSSASKVGILCAWLTSGSQCSWCLNRFVNGILYWTHSKTSRQIEGTGGGRIVCSQLSLVPTTERTMLFLLVRKGQDSVITTSYQSEPVPNPVLWCLETSPLYVTIGFWDLVTNGIMRRQTTCIYAQLRESRVYKQPQSAPKRLERFCQAKRKTNHHQA